MPVFRLVGIPLVRLDPYVVCCAVRDVVAVDIVMGLRSRMSQYGNYVSNWVQDYASVVLCPIPTGFQIGNWIPIGSLAITHHAWV